MYGSNSEKDFKRFRSTSPSQMQSAIFAENRFRASGGTKGGHMSQARTLRLEKVRQENVSATARLEKRHRRVFQLAKPPKQKERQTQKNQFSYLENISTMESLPNNEIKQGESGGEDISLSSWGTEKIISPEEVEKLLFRNKSDSTPGNLKRYVLRQDLTRFMQNMTTYQKKRMTMLVREHVKGLSETLRDKYQKELDRMNEKNVFHADANAQRAHTAFLAEFHAKLDVAALEDKVLEDMLNQQQRHAKLQKDPRALEKINNVLEGTPFGVAKDKEKKGRKSLAGTTGSKVKKQSSPRDERLQTASRPESAIKGSGAPGGDRLTDFSRSLSKRLDTALTDPNRFHNPVLAKLNEKAFKGKDFSDWDEFGRDLLDFENYKLAQSNISVDTKSLDTSKSTGDKAAIQDGNALNRLAEEQPEFTDFMMLHTRSPNRIKRRASLKTSKVLTDVTSHLEGLPEARAKMLIGSGLHTDEFQFRHTTQLTGTGRRKALMDLEDRPKTSGFPNTFLKPLDLAFGSSKDDSGTESRSPSNMDDEKRFSPSSSPEKNQSIDDRRRTSFQNKENAQLRSDQLANQIEDIWFKLQVPAVRRLHFLQTFCDVNRALNMKNMVAIWQTAADQIVLRQKLLGIKKRLGKGEVILSDKILTEEEVHLLEKCGCWVESSDIMGDDVSSEVMSQRISQRSSLTGGTPKEEAKRFSEEVDLLALEGKKYDMTKTKTWVEGILQKLTDSIRELIIDAEETHGEVITYCGVPYIRELTPVADSQEEVSKEDAL